MTSIQRYRLLVAGAFLALTAVISGCAYDVYGPAPDGGGQAAYYYDYDYYPAAGVYFNFYSGYYYYRSNNVWVRARLLPAHIYLGPRVALRIRSDKPYTYYSIHRERYRPSRSYQPSAARNQTERRYNQQRHERYLREYRH